MTLKIIVTGAFGNVGQWVLTELVLQGHKVTALDIKNERTEKKQANLAKKHVFDTAWSDITDETNIKKMISELKPDAIAHVAAIIAPTAYIIPEIAYKVNVLGSKNLIEAAESLDNFKRFVFVSSYSVHGPRNPHKNLPPLTGDSPTNPGDNYGKHKVAIEKRLENSKLEWNIVRLPAVFSIDSDFGSSAEFRKFGFLLDPNRNESAIDARDAGLAICNAVTVDPIHRKFDVCGDPKQGWTGKAKELVGGLISARGLAPFPDSAYRHSDPDVDESWYYEDIVDPTESQKVLQYQRSSLNEYLDFVKKQAGISKYILKLIGPLIKGSLLKPSIYYGKPVEHQKQSVWEDIKEQFGIDESKLTIFKEN